MTTYSCSMETPLGPMTATAENGAITGLWFVGQKYYPDTTADWVPRPEEPVFEKLRNWLGDYFAGKNPKMNLPLAPQGTDFRKSVWDILLKIPFGKHTTYGEIAKQLAVAHGKSTMSAQAVGGAVGHNPISILIPCHRVLGANKDLTGYAGGLERKKSLLQIETEKCRRRPT